MTTPPPRDKFKVTHNDCVFTFSRASGPGGQNVNKRSTKAHCLHVPSGAQATCQEHREQYRNKCEAFQKMARTPEFQRWARIEAARRAGTAINVEENVARAMRPSNITVEIKRDGRWVKVDPKDFDLVFVDDASKNTSLDEDTDAGGPVD